jgi:hypothetical protein
MLNKAGRFFAVFLLCAVPAYGAELNCFTSPAEARGFYFLRFTVEQMTSAKRCDDSYALWNPSLFSISAQVVAGNPNERKPLAQSADDLAKRLGISATELFALAVQKTLPLLPNTVTQQDCELLARKLQIRLTDPSDLLFYTSFGAAAEEKAGHMCH